MSKKAKTKKHGKKIISKPPPKTSIQMAYFSGILKASSYPSESNK
jgi:hypothetical protein